MDSNPTIVLFGRRYAAFDREETLQVRVNWGLVAVCLLVWIGGISVAILARKAGEAGDLNRVNLIVRPVIGVVIAAYLTTLMVPVALRFRGSRQPHDAMDVLEHQTLIAVVRSSGDQAIATEGKLGFAAGIADFKGHDFSFRLKQSDIAKVAVTEGMARIQLTRLKPVPAQTLYFQIGAGTAADRKRMQKEIADRFRELGEADVESIFPPLLGTRYRFSKSAFTLGGVSGLVIAAVLVASMVLLRPPDRPADPNAAIMMFVICSILGLFVGNFPALITWGNERSLNSLIERSNAQSRKSP